MDKGQRKRHAAVAAAALLDWRTAMARENADRDNAERETMIRYDRMIAEMRAQAEQLWKLRAEHQALCKLVAAAVHGAGAAGALEGSGA